MGYAAGFSAGSNMVNSAFANVMKFKELKDKKDERDREIIKEENQKNENAGKLVEAKMNKFSSEYQTQYAIATNSKSSVQDIKKANAAIEKINVDASIFLSENSDGMAYSPSAKGFLGSGFQAAPDVDEVAIDGNYFRGNKAVVDYLRDMPAEDRVKLLSNKNNKLNNGNYRIPDANGNPIGDLVYDANDDTQEMFNDKGESKFISKRLIQSGKYAGSYNVTSAEYNVAHTKEREGIQDARYEESQKRQKLLDAASVAEKTKKTARETVVQKRQDEEYEEKQAEKKETVSTGKTYIGEIVNNKAQFSRLSPQLQKIASSVTTSENITDNSIKTIEGKIETEMKALSSLEDKLTKAISDLEGQAGFFDADVDDPAVRYIEENKGNWDKPKLNRVMTLLKKAKTHNVWDVTTQDIKDAVKDKANEDQEEDKKKKYPNSRR